MRKKGCCSPSRGVQAVEGEDGKKKVGGRTLTRMFACLRGGNPKGRGKIPEWGRESVSNPTERVAKKRWLIQSKSEPEYVREKGFRGCEEVTNQRKRPLAEGEKALR